MELATCTVILTNLGLSVVKAKKMITQTGADGKDKEVLDENALVTPPEAMLLRKMHMPHANKEPVTEIDIVKTVERSGVAEKIRLMGLYGKAVRGGKVLVESTFPSECPAFPQTFKEAGFLTKQVEDQIADQQAAIRAKALGGSIPQSDKKEATATEVKPAAKPASATATK